MCGQQEMPTGFVDTENTIDKRGASWVSMGRGAWGETTGESVFNSDFWKIKFKN
jgi:hypothetical protein